MEQASPHPSPTPAGASTQSGWGILSWANLRGLLDTLNQGDAAQGQRAYVELQAELEGTFKKLQQYLALSPTVALSVASTCRAIQQEIDYVKSQQARPKKRRYIDANQDEDNVLACYKRMRDRLQDLPDNRLRDLVPSLSARYDLENAPNALTVKRGPCTQGTRTNVLDQMYQWVTDQDTGKIYWMSGMAGTGKTTIAYSLCKRLDTGSRRMLGASFFCSRLVPECRNVGKIVPSIAYQLARRSQPFQYALCQAMKNNPDAQAGGPSSQFQLLIVGPLSDSKVREALPPCSVVVIDALDECEDETSTRQILDVLLTHSEGFPIKFVVSSRPEATIRERMARNDDRVVLHELDKKEVQSDIKAYLREGLSRMSPSEPEIEKLAERAGVLFIYAATVIRYVGYDDFGRNPRARLNAVLAMAEKQGTAQTEEIDQLYGAILESAIGDRGLEPNERDDMKLILHTVVCAKSPLTLDALNGLLKLDDVDRIHAALRPLWSVLHVMGPEMTVTTLHASFFDYLTDRARSGITPWHCNVVVHHGFLAQRSLERIRDTIPQFNICKLESSYLYDEEVEDLEARVEKYIPLELRYACQYWSAHLLFASDPGLLSQLEQFLTKQLLLWMEVMNLTKNIAPSPGHLAVAKHWAAKHGATCELIELMQDAWRFAQTVVSSPVSQSTPHIYVSILPFLSSHSPIRKHYAHLTRGMVEVEGTALDRRKPLLARWSLQENTCAACSPDGTLIATVPADSSDRISIMDISSGREIRNLSHSDVGVITCVAFSPDETRVASGGYHGNIYVWNIDSGRPVIESLDCHQGLIRSITYSHNGAHFISGSEDCTIRIWDAYSGQSVFTPLVGHTNRVTSVAISPDDTKIVSGSSDSTVRVWDTKSGRLVLDPIKAHTEDVYSVAFAPNNSFIVSSGDGIVRVWDSHTGQSLLSPFSHIYGAHSIAISPDSTCIAASLGGGTILIGDVDSGKAVFELPTEDTVEAHVLAYSSDGTRIISYTQNDGTLCLFDAQSKSTPLSPFIGHTDLILAIDVSPDGKRIVSGSQDGTICVWDPITSQLVLGPLGGHARAVHLVRYSPVGSRFLSCSYDETLRQWDAQTGDCLEVNNPIVDTCTHHGYFGWQILISAAVCLWSSKTGEQILGPMEGKWECLSIQFSTDGTTLLTGWDDGAVRIWDVQSGQLVSSIRSQEAFLLHIWDAQTGDSVFGPLKGHIKRVTAIAYSPDGTYIASASEDVSIRVWDVSTQLESAPLIEWVLNNDGWVVDEQSQRLIWVPVDLRNSLLLPRNTALVSRDGYVRLKLNGALIGEARAGCWLDS
ncbi:unnamed protein product [Rhizoctonia solani]|uniref:Nephrocystin 3-like N-terminal domain-containing protein n=1 Tax=Rhizoctonia solani TaxID=456999 RepID=A0A8H3A671_9AGAM|nr:unnamed protein product [Rhizoctonia solani]